MATSFEDADVEVLKTFGAFVTNKAKMTLDMNEVVDLHKLLVAYNRVVNKIAAAIEAERQPEPPKIVPGPPPAPEAPSKGKK